MISQSYADGEALECSKVIKCRVTLESDFKDIKVLLMWPFRVAAFTV